MKYLVHILHENTRCISNSKRHNRILIMSIPRSKCSLLNIFRLHTNLMISRPQINLTEYTIPNQLVHQIINPRQWIPILDLNFIQFPVLIHSLIEPSFFLTNNTGAPYGETLGRINFFSSNSSNFFFNSDNSDADMRYGAIDTGLVPGIKSMAISTSLSGGNSLTSSGNTSGNSLTTGNSPLLAFPFPSVEEYDINTTAPSLTTEFICLTDIVTFSTLVSSGNMTVYSNQLI